MLTFPVHISPKGQVVLPKAVRAALGTENVVFEVTEHQVTIKPMHSMAGALEKYKKNYKDFSRVREQAWSEALDER